MNRSKLSIVLSAIIGLIILATTVTFAYVITVPARAEAFTEFYILGAQGKAANYPKRLAAGEPGTVNVGIINREKETTSYRVEMRLDGNTEYVLGPLVLEDEEKFERAVSFTPESPGENQKLEFLLLKEGEDTAYDSLYLMIDVSE